MSWSMTIFRTLSILHGFSFFKFKNQNGYFVLNYPNVHERACYEHSKSFRFRAKKEGKKFAESFPHDGGAQCAKSGKK